MILLFQIVCLLFYSLVALTLCTTGCILIVYATQFPGIILMITWIVGCVFIGNGYKLVEKLYYELKNDK